MRSFQSALVGSNNSFYFYSQSLIVCLSKTLKYLVCPCKCRVKLSVQEAVFFPVSEEIIYILFSISFLIFWNSINLTYVLRLGNKDLISAHTFTSQRESHCVPDMVSLPIFNYFVPLGVIENRFTKISQKYFNGNYDNSRWWYCQ